MKEYIYPNNLKARAGLWLWSLRDLVLVGIMAMISLFLFVNLGWIVPMAVTMCCAFMTIRLDDITVVDFICYAVKYFISTQQYFEWRSEY